MARVTDYICRTKREDFAFEESDKLRGFLRHLLRLVSGVSMLSAIATPREGGCEASAKIHGAGVPLQCLRHGESLRVRVGGSVLLSGMRTSRQARPGLDVTYRFGNSQLDAPPEPCTCDELRKVILEASWGVLLSSDELWKGARFRFANHLFLIDGLTGHAAVVNGSGDSRDEFALRHVGTCFRQALENGTDARELDIGVRDLRARVHESKLLVSWDFQDASMTTQGVILQMYASLLTLAAYARKLAIGGDVSPQSKLCETAAPRDGQREGSRAAWESDIHAMLRKVNGAVGLIGTSGGGDPALVHRRSAAPTKMAG